MVAPGNRVAGCPLLRRLFRLVGRPGHLIAVGIAKELMGGPGWNRFNPPPSEGFQSFF